MTDALAAVRFEAHRGELVLAGTVVVQAEEAGRRGELRLRGADGPVLRPVSFGERTRAAARAAVSSGPCAVFAASLLRAATVAEGVADRLVQEIVALWLAGAGVPGPPFAETVLAVARAAGWDPRQIAEAEAAEVDRLAAAVGARPAEGPWRRLVLAPAAAPDLEALRNALAEGLLARARVDGPAAAAVPDGDTPGPPAPAAPPAGPPLGAAGAPRAGGAPTDAAAPVPRGLRALGMDPAARARAASPSRRAGGASAPSGAPARATAVATPVAAPPSLGRAAAAPSGRAAPPPREPAASTAPASFPTAGTSAAGVAPVGSAEARNRYGRDAAAGVALRIWSDAGADEPHVPARAGLPAPAEAATVPAAAASARPAVAEADLADALAALLDDEADLRGLER